MENIHTTFIDYAKNSNLKKVTEALIHGMNVDIINEALVEVMTRICMDRLGMVTILLQNGANVHTHDDVCLRESVAHDNLPLVRILLDNGADVHSHDDEALRDAVFYLRVRASVKYYVDVDHLAIVNILLAHGANLYANDNER